MTRKCISPIGSIPTVAHALSPYQSSLRMVSPSQARCGLGYKSEPSAVAGILAPLACEWHTLVIPGNAKYVSARAVQW